MLELFQQSWNTNFKELSEQIDLANIAEDREQFFVMVLSVTE